MSQPGNRWIDTLPRDAGALLRVLGRVESYADGAVVIREGAAENHLFLIESGTARVADLDREILLGPGELVGEMAFLDDAPRRRDVTATGPLQLRRIERLELATALAGQPELLRSVLDAIAALKTQRTATAAPPATDDAASCVARLAEESLRHRAVRHPYLEALGSGTLPDLRWALADFARQYRTYSSHFPRYLTTVISRLENPAHRGALLENLTEESGSYGDDELAELQKFGVQREWIDGVPHPLLFQRFAASVGVQRDDVPESDQAACWRELFLALLASGSPAEALGALGLGTENIVRTIYQPFVAAIARVGTLAPRDTVFFPLHTAVDDHHQATLQAISADYAHTPEGRRDLRRGMLKALNLRSAFWDWLLARALDPAGADAVV